MKITRISKDTMLTCLVATKCSAKKYELAKKELQDKDYIIITKGKRTFLLDIKKNYLEYAVTRRNPKDKNNFDIAVSVLVFRLLSKTIYKSIDVSRFAELFGI